MCTKQIEQEWTNGGRARCTPSLKIRKSYFKVLKIPKKILDIVYIIGHIQDFVKFFKNFKYVF
jgi:hypothetical protein